MKRPPVAARLLLRLLLPRRLFDAIAGDLEEEWHDGRLGRARYWLLALRSVADCWILYLPPHRRRPSVLSTYLSGDAGMISLLQDVRYGSRMMRSHVGFTLAAVTTLAVGIGATSAIFSLINALVLEPLPYRDASRVAFVLGTDTETGDLRFSLRLADYLDIHRHTRTFRHVAAYTGAGGNLTGGDLPERVQAYRVTGSTFELLGVSAALGRTLSPADARPGRDRVAVLSDGLWRRRFGGDTGILRRRISLNGVTHDVVGVMPPEFEFPVFNFKGDLWVPWSVDATGAAANRGESGSATVIARLDDETSLEEASAEMRALMRTLATEYPATNATLGVRVVEMGRLGDEQAGPAMALVIATVGIVLLLACGNVANLLLARGVSRERELAVRAAVGASGARILRQLLVEAGMLALLGGLAGLALAHIALGAIRAALPDLIRSTLPNIESIRLDGFTLGFTLVVSLGATVLFGMMPAWRAARPGPTEALRGSGVGGGRATRRLRHALLVGEVALATLLLIGASLLARSYAGLRAVDPGFEPDGVLTLALTLPEDRYPADADRQLFFDRLIERVGDLPGVRSAALVNVLPFSTYDRGTRVEIDGAPLPAPGREWPAALRVISPAYFDTLSIRVHRGRGFTTADRSGSLPVAVVNRSFDARYLDGTGPGRRVRLGDEASGNPWMTVVGVVDDVRHSALQGAVGPQIYLPVAQGAPSMMMMAVRVAGPPLDLVTPVRREIQSIDPQQPAFHVKPMRELLDAAMLLQTASAALMAVFSAIALVLAAVGVFSVVSYGVTQQMPEFGVRLALGATPRELGRLIVGRASRLVGAGVLIGVAAAAGLTGGLAGLLYGVTPLDPLAFAAAAGTVALLGLGASLIPAWRAASAEPVSALRAN